MSIDLVGCLVAMYMQMYMTGGAHAPGSIP